MDSLQTREEKLSAIADLLGELSAQLNALLPKEDEDNYYEDTFDLNAERDKNLQDAIQL
jgi:hypothetical protein